MGADVVKIEPPGGDEARGIPPFKDDSPQPERSLCFHHCNSNNRVDADDGDMPDGRAILLELANKADVVNEAYRPARREEVGLDYHDLSVGDAGVVRAAS